MNNFNSMLILINTAAAITVFFGISLLLILISRRYLDVIFEHIDNIVKTQKAPLYLEQARLSVNSNIYDIVKRLLDFVFASICLFLVLPTIFVISLVIKLNSPGPVFFRQKRIGKGGKTFYAYKFRTMTTGAAEKALKREEFKNLPRDARVTRVGHFLRETSLDELPKLVNILIGDMSVVGTSSAADYIYDEYGDDKICDFIALAKPGLISLWVLSGKRWRYDVESRLLFDCYYVSHQSLALDFTLLLMAVPSILGRVGAR